MNQVGSADHVSGSTEPAFAQLALTLHSAPGQHALLVGSGISFSAGIPTGWAVVSDLATRVATAADIDPIPTDPVEWYVSEHDDEHNGRGPQIRQDRINGLETARQTSTRNLIEWATAWPNRVWAIEGAKGLGALVAQQLVAAGEHVVDVPATLTSQARLLETGGGRKADQADARTVARIAIARPLTAVRAEDHSQVLRVRRLWRDEGLRVPQGRRRKRLTGVGVAVGAMCPIRPNVLWAMDFQFDTTADGRTLKLLNIIDEYTRECLTITIDRSIDADHVVAVLDRLVVERGGAPAYLRFDNGPEFVANSIADWCSFTRTGAVFIDPGSPWQNAWIESFNGRLRDEMLNLWHFDSLLEAQVLIEDWRQDYNNNRPHSAHNGLTPAEFDLNWIKQNQPSLA